MMWLLVIDRPYYPSVQTFHNQEAAKEAFLRAVCEHGDEAPHATTVYLAEPLAESKIQTYY